MSWNPADDPECSDCASTKAIETIIDARAHDIGGYAVGRVLPSPRRRMVGPFIFFDHMGPGTLAAGSTLALPTEHHDRAVYVVSGTVRCGAETVDARRMIVLAPGQAPPLQAQSDAQVMLLGGAPLEGRRHIFWNFVSSRPERIEQAKRDWEEGKFPLVPGDSEERIPLPK